MSPSLPSSLSLAEEWTERKLLRQLQENAENIAIVTSTERAARRLQHGYTEEQLTGGSSGWRSPEILAWKSWLATLWDAGALHGLEKRLLLTDFQELALWQKIVANDEAAQKTISLGTLAETAQKTWKEMQRHEIRLDRLNGNETLDVKYFQRWAGSFEKLCRESFFLPSSQLEEAISQWVLSPKLSFPKEIYLVGFDRIVPSQLRLIDALRQRSIAVRFVELAPPGTSPTAHAIICSQTTEDEIASVAHWTRERLLRDPEQQIGILVPSLETTRNAIDAIFRRVLAPSTMEVRSDDSKLPYEFSLGIGLRRMPPIQTALLLLLWLNRAVTTEDVSWLLVHGCFGEGFDVSRDPRGVLDRKFRERKFQLGESVSFAAIRRWLAQTGNADIVASFRKTLDNIFRTSKGAAIEKPRSFAEWREIIEGLLATAQWHLLAPQISADYQLLQRWNSVLDSFASLTSVSGPVSFAIALETLEHIVSQTLFTLHTSNAPVLIVGVAESAGLVFDAAWWINANTGAWPAQGKPLPFLPWTLQRQAHMPHADAKEDYAFALRTTKRILECADVVNVSFSLQQDATADVNSYIPAPNIALAPLVCEIWPTTPIEHAARFSFEDFQDSQNNSAECDRLESIDEEAAIPLHGSAVRGGVRFLELQAACPFRAFAELRLGARCLETAPNGISTRDQGSVIHAVLDQFWKQVQTQQALLTMPQPELRANLQRYIDAALAEFSAAAEEPWQKHLLSVEAERLLSRLSEWLEVERQRPEFTVVSTETDLKNSELGGVHFHCRVDRMDRVEQGIALLDYKTGKVDRKSCEGDRPDQPQLPSYAVLHRRSAGMDDPLAGIAFAGLHPQKVGLNAIRSLPSVFKKGEEGFVEDAESRKTLRIDPFNLTSAQMRDVENIWRETLTRLAEAFRAGLAMVDPKKHAQTCKYCEQNLLCRIRETTVLGDDAEESTDDIPCDGSEQ